MTRPSQEPRRVGAYMVEPHPGHSDEELVAALKEAGATKVQLLAPGFISAEAAPAVVRQLSDRADFHEKHAKQLRTAS